MVDAVNLQAGVPDQVRGTIGSRAAALGRAFAFLAIAVGTIVALLVLASHSGLIGKSSKAATLSLRFLLAQEVICVSGMATATMVMRAAFRSSRQELRALWARSVRRSWTDLATGWGAGVGFVTVLLGGISIFGGLSLGWSTQAPWETLKSAFLWAAVFGLTAIFEEGLFRGFLLAQLSRAITFWPAALVSSALFALAHGTNGGMSATGLVATALIGLLFAYCVRLTGSLWFVIGFPHCVRLDGKFRVGRQR